MARTALWLVLATIIAAGCGAPAVPRDRITFAVMAGVYCSPAAPARTDAVMAEDSETLLRKAVADLNAAKNLDFVVVAGDLLSSPDGFSLDRAKSILDNLKVPYYVVLGVSDGPAARAKPAAGAPSGRSAPGPAPGAVAVSRSTVTWAFQGHGFSGPDGYWSHEVLPGMIVVGLDTAQTGRREGNVGARQLDWLERTLAANAGKSVVVVAYHELMPLNPLDEGVAWHHRVLENAAAVRQVLERHPNVLMVVSGDSHFAEGRVGGSIVYLASPSVSIWPLAYHLVRLTPKEAEAVWVPLAPDDVARRAQDRLLADPEFRGVFPPGEDGDTACVRLFGGKKLEVYPLPAIRP